MSFENYPKFNSSESGKDELHPISEDLKEEMEYELSEAVAPEDLNLKRFKEEGEAGLKKFGIEHAITSINDLIAHIDNGRAGVVAALVRGWKEKVIDDNEYSQKPQYILDIYEKAIPLINNETPDLFELRRILELEKLKYERKRDNISKTIEERSKN